MTTGVRTSGSHIGAEGKPKTQVRESEASTINCVRKKESRDQYISIRNEGFQEREA